MRSFFRASVLLILAVCYSLTVSVTAHPVVASDVSVISENSREAYFSTSLANLFCHTSQNVVLIPWVNNLPAPDTGFHPVSLLQMVKESEKLHPALFHQYSDYSLNTPVRFRKACIIFPFHNFW
jgi:hypothetical protein